MAAGGGGGRLRERRERRARVRWLELRSSIPTSPCRCTGRRRGSGCAWMPAPASAPRESAQPSRSCGTGRVASAERSRAWWWRWPDDRSPRTGRSQHRRAPGGPGRRPARRTALRGPAVELEPGGGGQRRTGQAPRRRSAAADPLHIGVLLGNVPEYLFWLGAAALAGAVVVGINPTRRGEALAGDVRRTDCRAGGHRRRRGRAARRARPRRAPRTGSSASTTPSTPTCWRPTGGPTSDQVVAAAGPRPEDLYLLLFTSGTTGAPKAVRCTQGRLAAIAVRSAEAYGFDRGDVAYCTMPLFHGNALMVLWGPSLVVGATVALARRFSASGFGADIRRYGATTFTYVGKALAYVLATPASARRRHHHPPPGLRHRGLGGRPRRLRAAVRLRADRGLRLQRGRGGHQPDAGHPGGVAGPPVRGRGGRRPGHAGSSARRPSSTRPGGWPTAARPSGRSSTAPGRAASRATTPTRRPPRPGSATAGTGPVTWPTATRPATSTSPAAGATGCGSTRRT